MDWRQISEKEDVYSLQISEHGPEFCIEQPLCAASQSQSCSGLRISAVGRSIEPEILTENLNYERLSTGAVLRRALAGPQPGQVFRP
ncbi:hypothetical protein Hanom_Chr12g01126281 [Helianthus anomalus]